MVGDGFAVLVDLGCYGIVGIAVVVVCGSFIVVIVAIGGRRGLLLVARVLNEESIEDGGVVNVSIGALHFLKWGGCCAWWTLSF